MTDEPKQPNAAMVFRSAYDQLVPCHMLSLAMRDYARLKPASSVHDSLGYQHPRLNRCLTSAPLLQIVLRCDTHQRSSSHVAEPSPPTIAWTWLRCRLRR